MVKIEGLNKKEKKEKARVEELEKIAFELFPESNISNWGGDVYVRFNKKGFLSSKPIGRLRYFQAFWSGNEIMVDTPELLEQAKDLAKAYEKRFKKEFMVKKEYE